MRASLRSIVRFIKCHESETAPNEHSWNHGGAECKRSKADKRNGNNAVCDCT